MSARLVSTLLMAGLLVPRGAVAHAAGTAGVTTWPDVAAALALASSAALYALAWRRGAALRPRHVAAFAAGWAAAAIAQLPALDGAAAGSFAWHMLQHELLMVLAPPLLILGRPFAALAAVVPASALRVIVLPLRVPPPAAWLAHAVALWIWHVPRLFGAALQSPNVHALQHASFFLTALLFWWAVFRRVRTGVATLYVLTTMLHMGALGALLTFAPAPLYATTLDDQQLGGLVMWVPAGYALLLAGLVAFDRFVRAPG